MDHVDWSRSLTTMTLAFHIIFATIGVGVPIMLMIAEFIGIKFKDDHYILLARRWAKGFTITVAVGVVTGTAIGLQLSLIWPSFMRVAGQVISLPLFMETFAFFFEAIFLSIYLYTWDRFKNPWHHWLLTIPVVIGSTLSAFFITTVNGFMNTPQGFTIVDGVLTNVQPLMAMFNPATPSKAFHVIASSFATTAAILAANAAFHIVRGKRHVYFKKALKLTLICTLLFSFLNALAGDLSAKFLAKHQPEKLAAGEWHFETERGADLILWGYLDENNEVKGAIHLPNLLSFLSFNDFNAEVKGLNEFPEDERPPLWIHYLFDTMVTVGGLMIVLSFIPLFLMWRKKSYENRYLLWSIVALGPLSMIGIEAGWFFAEVGRQPWLVRGFMKVYEGATTDPNVAWMFGLFACLYFVLGVVCVMTLRKMFTKNTLEHDLARYGMK